ncbi:hypothetical protein RA19_05410 [Leisingera sp. ANG-M1]|nr:hypothetical protein RA19_05410 [Leisingera sp. ANG-M1]
MRTVCDTDWAEHLIPQATNDVLERLVEGQSPNLHFGWLALLYKKYRLGDWNNVIPDPGTIPDKTYLMHEAESYCLFHLEHEKFGSHIIECANPYAENVFVFFDYSSMVAVFEVLDAQDTQPELQTPYVPIYYAHPHDRYDYKTGTCLWEEP